MGKRKIWLVKTKKFYKLYFLKLETLNFFVIKFKNA